MIHLRNMYELPPIDDWSKSLSLKKVFGMYAEQVEEEVFARVSNYSKETPHTIRCGIIGNPDSYNFEPVVYAKIDNNGTVYAFTDANIDGFDQCNERRRTTYYRTVEDMPF